MMYYVLGETLIANDATKHTLKSDIKHGSKHPRTESQTGRLPDLKKQAKLISRKLLVRKEMSLSG